MSNIAVEIANLQEDVHALHARMIIERDVADYWYQRCQQAEDTNKKLAEQLYDEINNQRKS